VRHIRVLVHLGIIDVTSMIRNDVVDSAFSEERRERAVTGRVAA
jgi:hypothetical protein